MLATEILTDRLAHLQAKKIIKEKAINTSDALETLTDKRIKILKRINNAIDKIQDNPETYGICESCEEHIELTRLESLPEATLCLECKIVEEKAGDD